MANVLKMESDVCNLILRKMTSACFLLLNNLSAAWLKTETDVKINDCLHNLCNVLL